MCLHDSMRKLNMIYVVNVIKCIIYIKNTNELRKGGQKNLHTALFSSFLPLLPGKTWIGWIGLRVLSKDPTVAACQCWCLNP